MDKCLHGILLVLSVLQTKYFSVFFSLNISKTVGWGGGVPIYDPSTESVTDSRSTVLILSFNNNIHFLSQPIECRCKIY